MGWVGGLWYRLGAGGMGLIAGMRGWGLVGWVGSGGRGWGLMGWIGAWWDGLGAGGMG